MRVSKSKKWHPNYRMQKTVETCSENQYMEKKRIQQRSHGPKKKSQRGCLCLRLNTFNILVIFLGWTQIFILHPDEWAKVGLDVWFSSLVRPSIHIHTVFTPRCNLESPTLLCVQRHVCLLCVCKLHTKKGQPVRRKRKPLRHHAAHFF